MLDLKKLDTIPDKTELAAKQIEVIKGQIDDTKVKIGVTKEIITEIRCQV